MSSTLLENQTKLSLRQLHNGVARGPVAAVAPLGLDSDKNYCCISSSYYITITVFFLREAFCGLEYAENCIFGRGLAPDSTGEAYDAPPDLLVGWGEDTPPQTPPHSARRSALPPYT